MKIRFTLLITILALGTSLAPNMSCNAFAQDANMVAKIASDEMYLGKADAKLTLIEYGSLTCSHCAHFQEEIFPKIKAKYIDTGKIKYAFRTLPTPPFELAIGLQVLADCSGSKRFELIDEYFAQQDILAYSANSSNGPLKTAIKIARHKTGLDEESAKACLMDDSKVEKVQKTAQIGAKAYGLTGTPSFILNGKLIKFAAGEKFDFATFSKRFDKELANIKTKAKPK